MASGQLYRKMKQQGNMKKAVASSKEQCQYILFRGVFYLAHYVFKVLTNFHIIPSADARPKEQSVVIEKIFQKLVNYICEQNEEILERLRTRPIIGQTRNGT